VRRTIAVIGDSLLDVDVVTTAERLSPDGPVPVLDEVATRVRAGGAALAAALVARAAAGTDVVLVTPVADDEDGRELLDRVDGRVRVVPLPCTGATSVKTRLRCAGQTIARLDRGGPSTGDVTMTGEAREVLAAADAVLVSDYGRGLTQDTVAREILADVASRVPVVWDPHPRGGPPVPGAALVTPNAAEAARATARTVATDVGAACEQADELVTRWAARAVTVTLGRSGAVLSQGSGAACAFPPPTAVDADPCGAGDCFAAAATVALAARRLPSEAVLQAVAAASGFLAGGGVAALDAEDHAAPGAPEPPGDLDATLDRLRAEGRTIVATGGCFDLLHAGHIATLTAARNLGDFLVVCLNSDDSVRRLKGESRPLQPAEDRRRVLESLRAVDAVVVFEESTPEQILRRIRPHLWVKGGDYAGQVLPEAELVRSWGGRVVSVPYLAGRSTSDLVDLARR
jgi:D-beta-D-heptose 7-phosphate kinase / D-beta-D-heptose 1-phosphate adenosyltransferase